MNTLLNSVYINDVNGVRHAIAARSIIDDRDKDGRAALIHAAINGGEEVARVLIDSGANVNARDNLGNTPLHYAALDFHIPVVMLLPQNGAAVDAADRQGNTPLFRAVYGSKGRCQRIAILLKHGANRDHVNSSGISPLQLVKSIANYNARACFD